MLPRPLDLAGRLRETPPAESGIASPSRVGSAPRMKASPLLIAGISASLAASALAETVQDREGEVPATVLRGTPRGTLTLPLPERERARRPPMA